MSELVLQQTVNMSVLVKEFGDRKEGEECQDWFSQLEADVNGDARLMGEHVGCGE